MSRHDQYQITLLRRLWAPENKYRIQKYRISKVSRPWTSLSLSPCAKKVNNRTTEAYLVQCFFYSLNTKDLSLTKNNIKITNLIFVHHVWTYHGGTYHGIDGMLTEALKVCFFLYTELKRFEFGKEWYQKNQLNVCLSCRDISWGDIPWNWWGKGLRAWPLCIKLIIWYVLKGFLSKIDAA